ncbi:MAG: M24 family metallopeptidase [Planctomycetota bacterium]
MPPEREAKTFPTRRALLGTGSGILAAAALPGCSSPPPTHESGHDEEIEDGLRDLTDRRGDVEPISAEERAARRRRLGRILADRGLDAFLLEGGATMRYLAGFSWGRSERFFGLVVLADGSHFWISPAFEESRARLSIDEAGGDIVTWQEDEYFARPLAAALSDRRVERLAIEPSLRQGFAVRLAAQAGAPRIDGAAGADVLAASRARKDAHELAILRRANELTQLAIQAAARCLVPGMSGREVASIVDRAHRKLGFTSPWNLSLIGPAAALPHGDPDARPLARGDVVLVDAGGDFHGYQSDETRTWVFDGNPTVAVERAWNAVRSAQMAAFEAIAPGKTCGDIDRAARATIVELGFRAGYDDFTHRLGHGIGMEGHEDPYFDGGSTVVLEPGMTLSNEPGLYFPGRFGLRIEDIVAITTDGADHFGTWQRGPSSPE